MISIKTKHTLEAWRHCQACQTLRRAILKNLSVHPRPLRSAVNWQSQK